MKYEREMKRVFRRRVGRMIRAWRFIKGLYYVEGDVAAVPEVTNGLRRRLAKPTIVVRVSHWTQVIDLPRLKNFYTIVDCPFNLPLPDVMSIFAVAQMRNLGFQTSYLLHLTSRRKDDAGITDWEISQETDTYRDRRLAFAKGFRFRRTRVWIPPMLHQDFRVDLTIPDYEGDIFIDVNDWTVVDTLLPNPRFVVRCSVALPLQVKFRVLLACRSRYVLRFQCCSI